MPKSIENTVFVRFVPTPRHKVMRHQLEDIFSQIGPIKKSSWINAKVSSSAEERGPISSSKGYGFVKYIVQEDAKAAMKELHDTKIEMEGQQYTLKVELASLSATSKTTGAPRTTAGEDDPSQEKEKHFKQAGSRQESDKDAESLGDDSAASAALLKKKSRIILRNLSFYAKENHIRKAMESKYGKVLDVHLPRVQNNLHVGFCFVTFENPKDAEKAVQEKHVDIQKRTVNMDWSLPKKVHQQQKKQQQQQQQQHEKNDSDDEDDDKDGEEEKEPTNDMEMADVSDTGSSDDHGNSSSSSSEDDSDKDDAAINQDADSGSGGSDEQNSDDESDDDEEEPKDDAVNKKCCLFLRNLPFDATRHDLFQLFSKFGYIKGIYLVKDKNTGMMKGTAFVTYSKPQFAQRAMEHAAASSTTDIGVSSFVSQRQAVVDIGTSETAQTKGSLLLKGRKILVDLAVDKETASTFDSKEHKIPSADRRNLYLQAEARVESSSTDPQANNANTWDDLPQQDQKKRQTALKDKTTKLQSPIFFINPNRLSVRNMAKHVDEAGLQKLCVLAVKRGLEKRLVGAQDQIAHWRAQGEMSTREILAKVQEMEANGEDIIPLWDDKTNIKEYIPSVYIDRDFGPSGKKADAPSRGFGFAEFTHHAHALACLRELNNNPAYSRDYAAGGKAADSIKKRFRKTKKGAAKGGGDYVGEDGRVHVPRLIVDFTVENKIKAKKQAERRMQQQLNQTKQKIENKVKGKEEDETGDKKKKRNRGAIQREKKRQKRESGEEEAERQAQLQAKALVEAKKELRKERMEQKKKKLEDVRRMSVKPPKNKPRMDEEDEEFEHIVRSYTSKLETTREGQEIKNTRATLDKKRWFE